MCGIVGLWNWDSGEPADTHILKRMTGTIIHRGPDDEGFFTDGDLGLGFRRLSIIDLAGGHQPMSDLEEKVWVVFNGEIYNFPALKRELEWYGHVFRTRSDTEVIVHGYKQWGDDILNRLNGMFGLAIWDTEKRRLVVARDPMGIKSIYYREEKGRLTFASEVRPLLAASSQKPGVDLVSLNLFLRYRYTPSPLTVFEGVRKLAPGTRLVADGKEVRVERWWNDSPEPFDPMPSDARAERELLEVYKQAVERQLISDVPVGLLLSGGMDSALLLALMKNAGPLWQTYTVGFGESFSDDEILDAEETARILDSPNVSVLLDRPTFEADLSNIVSILEEPVCAGSVVPMFHVCKRARQDVKVALMGQGPDELFGGYKRHLGLWYGTRWRSVPGWIRTPIKSVLANLPRSEAVRRALYSLDVPDRLERYNQVFSILPGPAIDGLFRDGNFSNGSGDKIYDCWRDLLPLMGETGEIGGLSFLEVRSSLPDELLMYADKLSMAHSLEVRVPFLDLEVVRYVERLSDRFKVRNAKRKWLHRRVCRKYLPASIINRKKRGFAGNVVDGWFRESMAGRFNELLLDEKSLMYEYLDPKPIGQMVAGHGRGESDFYKILFSLVVFEEWLRDIRSSSPLSVSSKLGGNA